MADDEKTEGSSDDKSSEVKKNEPPEEVRTVTGAMHALVEAGRKAPLKMDDPKVAEFANAIARETKNIIEDIAPPPSGAFGDIALQDIFVQLTKRLTAIANNQYLDHCLLLAIADAMCSEEQLAALSANEEQLARGQKLIDDIRSGKVNKHDLLKAKYKNARRKRQR